MSDQKKTQHTPENEEAREKGDDPFARDRAEERAKEAAAVGQAEAEAEEAAADADPLQERVQDLEESLKRSVAEQENLRKRMEREKAEVSKYAIAGFAREVLGIADNIQRAIDAVPKDAAEKDQALKTFLDGIEVTERELHKAMQRHGIAKLNPEGEKFDPNFHQAMFEIPTDEQPSGVVMQVVQPGYVLEDRVLRPAMVGVSKAAPAASGTNDNAAQTSDPAADTDAGQSPTPEDQSSDPATSQAAANEAGEATDSRDPQASTQQRGSSRLNEPVINTQDEDGSQAEPASRKA